MNKLLIIGCGQMGAALLKSWQKLKSIEISVVDPITYKILKPKYKNKNLKFYKNIMDLTNHSKFDIVLLAVKPQISVNVLKDFKNLKFKKSCTVVSIMAGKKINLLKKYFKNSNQFVRAMPNMPALTNNGFTCLLGNKYLSKKNKNLISKLFLNVGKVLWLNNEVLIDKATAVSGSGPGYIFNLVAAMENATVSLGFNNNQAREMVIQTFLGSLMLMSKTNKKSKDLIKAIALKGGTTEAGLDKMNQYNIQKIFKKTLLTSYKRARLLGKNI